MKIIMTIVAKAGIIFIMSSSALALGIGVYADSGGGRITWREKLRESGFKPDIIFTGGGFILDTCVAKDELLNLRANLGYNHIFSSFALNRIDATATLGFGIIRTKSIRFWLGPQLGIGYVFGNYRYQSTSDMLDAFWLGNGFLKTPALRDLYVLLVGLPKTKHFLAGELHGGVAAGVNFHLVDKLSLSIEGGGKIGTYARGGGSTSTSTDTSFNNDNPYFKGYFSIGIMYKVLE